MKPSRNPDDWYVTFYDHRQGTLSKMTVAEACADGLQVMNRSRAPEPVVLVGLSESEATALSLFRRLSKQLADASGSRR